MTVKIPPPVDRLVAAINAGDIAAFLAFFGTDGVVEDWGRRFKGPTAIRKWRDEKLIGAKGKLTVVMMLARPQGLIGRARVERI